MFSLLWLAGCGREAPALVALVALDAQTQYDLLADITAAQSHPDGRAHHAVRAEWTGRRVSWEVLWVPALCRSGACNVVPFDSRRTSELVDQGWLPRLTLDDAQVAALTAACAPHERCVFRFDGTLTTFRFDPQQMTRVGFEDVQIGPVRAALPEEAWGQRHPPGRDDLENVRKRAEELRARGFTPTLHGKGG